MSEEVEASNEVVQVQTSETAVQTTRSGRPLRPRDQSLYLFVRLTVKYPRLLKLMTLTSLHG